MRCFRTIGTRAKLEELKEDEAKHICEREADSARLVKNRQLRDSLL
jgi:hypothetical protein